MEALKEDEYLEELVVSKRIKELLNARGYEINKEFIPAVNAKVHELLEQCQARSTANNRKTLMVRDI